MRRVVLLGIAFLFLVSLAFAAETTETKANPETTEVVPAPAVESTPPAATESLAPVATEPEAPAAAEPTMAPAEEPVAPAATEQPTAAETILLVGDIIDNLCVDMQTSEGLPEFVKTHTKQCTLKPECVASGYSIFSDGKLYKFDKESNTKIEEFLKEEDSKLQVSITAKKVGEELSLVSIENQEQP